MVCWRDHVLVHRKIVVSVQPTEIQCPSTTTLGSHEIKWHSREQTIVGSWLCPVEFVAGIMS